MAPKNPLSGYRQGVAFIQLLRARQLGLLSFLATVECVADISVKYIKQIAVYFLAVASNLKSLPKRRHTTLSSVLSQARRVFCAPNAGYYATREARHFRIAKMGELVLRSDPYAAEYPLLVKEMLSQGALYGYKTR